MIRRAFLRHSLAGAAALSVGRPLFLPARAEPVPRVAGTPRTLSVVRRTIEVNGRAASVFGMVGPGGERGLVLRAGDTFDVALRNETSESTIVHWHGLTPPWGMDGVAGAPAPLLEPQAERSFSFPVGGGGTFWMHAHTLQEQSLLAAPLIVRDTDDDARDEQDVVILLHDFSFTPPEALFDGLRKGGTSGATGGHQGMAGMAMDLNDIDYDAYLANDRTLDDPEVVAVEAGGRVRMRIINGATATVFTVDLGALQGSLVAVDGHDVEPVDGSRFPLAMGQRIDVLVELPRGAGSFPILALREGTRERTGIVLRAANAPVVKIPAAGEESAPAIDLALEARLRSVGPLASRAAEKSFDMALTGDMQGGYRWGLEAPIPIVVDRGDRIEVTMRNTSAMAHPMHLHGHAFQVVAIDGQRFAGATRDTVHVPPQRAVTIALDADNPGQWAFHCHHLYHMAAGMMTTFAYAA